MSSRVIGTALAPKEAVIKLERGLLMNASLVVQKMKRYVAVILVLLIIGFAVEPITSVVSAHPAEAAGADTNTPARPTSSQFLEKAP